MDILLEINNLFDSKNLSTDNYIKIFIDEYSGIGELTTKHILILHLMGLLPEYQDIDDISTSLSDEIIILMYQLGNLTCDKLDAAIISTNLFKHIMSDFEFTKANELELKKILEELKEIVTYMPHEYEHTSESYDYIKKLLKIHYHNK